jgi:hypothetical protein
MSWVGSSTSTAAPPDVVRPAPPCARWSKLLAGTTGLDRVLAGANRHDSPLWAPTLDKLDELRPLPETVTVHLDAGYDSAATRQTLAERRYC